MLSQIEHSVYPSASFYLWYLKRKSVAGCDLMKVTESRFYNHTDGVDFTLS